MSYPIQTIFQQYYPAFVQQHHVSFDESKAAQAISRCKTSALGANASICEDCGHTQVHYNSCRNRTCPCCQSLPREKWIDKRKAEVLDVPYFHVVFTVPEELNPVIYANKALLYDLLYRSSADTLLELAKDKKHLGAKIGFLSVLHTWGQNLSYHPHIHCIVLGGGLSSDLKFVQSDGNFLFPVKVVSRLFRGKFISSLKSLFKEGRLSFSGSSVMFNDSRQFQDLIDLLYKKEWVPHLKKTFAGADSVIEYLGRYTHRAAIANSRIFNVSSDGISFHYKDYRTGNASVLTLKPSEFIRRFLMHVLPSGFVKLRYYGLFACRFKKKLLAICRNLTNSPQRSSHLEGLSTSQIIFQLFGIDLSLCSCCGSRNLKSSIFLPKLE